MLTWACPLTFNHTQVFPMKTIAKSYHFTPSSFFHLLLSLSGPSQSKFSKALSILLSLYVHHPLLNPLHYLPSSSTTLKIQLSLKLPVTSTLLGLTLFGLSTAFAALENSLHLEAVSSLLEYKFPGFPAAPCPLCSVTVFYKGFKF